MIFAVPRAQLLDGSVNSMTVIHEVEDPWGGNDVETVEYGEFVPDKDLMNSLPVPITGDERDMGWAVRKVLRVWRVSGDDYAVDFISSPGMEAIAAYMGVVTAYGHDDDWGTYLILSHGGGISTVYCHLIDVEVKLGQYVGTGDVIGHIGEKTDDVGAHLEFRIFADGEKADPEDYIETYMNGPLWTD